MDAEQRGAAKSVRPGPNQPVTRNAWLHRVRVAAYTCAGHWPASQVIAAIERWRLAREQATGPRRRLLYDVLIASAKDRLMARARDRDCPERAWLGTWSLENFYNDMPIWAIPGLGCPLSDDLNDGYTPRWQCTRYTEESGGLVEQVDQVYVRAEGWHSWSIAPGRNALYLGITPEPRA